MSEKIKNFRSSHNPDYLPSTDCNHRRNRSLSYLIHPICSSLKPKSKSNNEKGSENYQNPGTANATSTSWVLDHSSTPKSSNQPVPSRNTKVSSNALLGPTGQEEVINFQGKRRISFHQRLLALHKSRRQRKRAASDRDISIWYLPPSRPSIVNRLDFFYRFGEREEEALSSFNFLDNELPKLSFPFDQKESEYNEISAEEHQLLLQSNNLEDFSQTSSPYHRRESTCHFLSRSQEKLSSSPASYPADSSHT